MALLLTACEAPGSLHASASETFEFHGFSHASGTAIVEGYLTATVIDDETCSPEKCDSQLYLHFTVTESNSNSLLEFLNKQKGNTYAGPLFFGIGCLNKTDIRYQNASDALGMKEITISEATKNAILKSTPYTPIKLQVTKLPLSYAMQGPNCYSHFTEITLLE